MLIGTGKCFHKYKCLPANSFLLLSAMGLNCFLLYRASNFSDILVYFVIRDDFAVLRKK